MTRFLLMLFLCVFLVVGAAPAMAQINYDEATDGDISGGLPFDEFNLSAGTNRWIGTVGPTPAPNDVQDTFNAVVPADHFLTAIRCTGLPPDDGGANFAGFFEFNGVSSRTGSLIINYDPALPSGSYNARVVTDFSPGARSWTIEIDVEDRTPLPTHQTTWGGIKALFAIELM